jgi:hypothetical protein
MSNQQTKLFGKADDVTLLPSDLGLDFVFIQEGAASVRVSLDWLQVADLTLRVDKFGNEALTMMQIGLNPCHEPHRDEFCFAGLLAATSTDGPSEYD